MAERLILDDAEYAVLRSLGACRGADGRVPKPELLDHVRSAGGITAERAMKAIGDLYERALLSLDHRQQVFLASGVDLHAAGSAMTASTREDDGKVHLVLPEI